MEDRTKNYMLAAMFTAMDSKCHRRKIGCVLVDDVYEELVSKGYNSCANNCESCERLNPNNVCPAVHAEVNAISHGFSSSPNEMYIWSEVPCHQCLSYIAIYSDIATIYCLSGESYYELYPHVNQEAIRMRKEYALELGMIIIELDRAEIMEV
jgi:deoxycytidylate deaminase